LEACVFWQFDILIKYKKVCTKVYKNKRKSIYFLVPVPINILHEISEEPAFSAGINAINLSDGDSGCL